MRKPRSASPLNEASICAFALLKNDFGSRRFLTRGKANIRTERFLLALAFDLKKPWMKRGQGRLQTRVSMKMTAQLHAAEYFPHLTLE